MPSTSFDFDKIIDRRGTQAVKYELIPALFKKDDVIPLWVADMDFETPAFIRHALEARLAHPIYGYTVAPESYWQSIMDWQYKRHGWAIQKEWLTYIPGIVKGIGLVELCFTQPGDTVVIQPPVYHPFRLVTEHNGRHIVNNPLRWDGAQYQMDFDHLEQLLSSQPCKLFILSNPHNPGGQVWDKPTLARLAALCHAHGTLVISDEIHADMALPPYKHTPFATASAQAAEISITFGAPTKTFNIAGLVSSFAIVPDSRLRSKFYGFLEANELNATTFMATIATEVAFTQGEPWREAMLRYVQGNVDYICQTLPQCVPGIKVIPPQASFLVWLDCRSLRDYGVSDIPQYFINAGIGMNDGAQFGPGGEGFMRMNVGCPRATLEAAVERLYRFGKRP